MPAKQIKRTVWLSEAEFKHNEGFRNELYEAINSPAFRQAVHILTKRREQNEASLEGAGMIGAQPYPEVASVRLHSQRIGMEGFLNDLDRLCDPPIIPPQEKAAKFNANVPDDFEP